MFRENKNFGFLLVIASACFILFPLLGMHPLEGSEGRWALIARSMYQTGNLFSPMLGTTEYWDKPLLSYWQILPGAYLLGGVDEFVSRLPSTLWALVMLFLTYHLASKWFNKSTAVISGAVLCTSFGFIFWGRNAQVEMANASVIMLSIWYFLNYKKDQEYSYLFILGIIMGIGANLKGLTAVAVPTFTLLLLSLIKKDWKWVPSVKIVIPIILVFLFSYLLVPMVGSFFSSSWDPFRLIWRENVVRFFAPFDHKNPFYLYFYSIFGLAAPWSVILPLALIYDLKGRKYRESRIYDVLIIFSGIFIFFSLSGSRRGYYLLPILPFSSILIGDFLSRFFQGTLPSRMASATKGIHLIIGFIMTLPLILFLLKPHEFPSGVEKLLPWSIIVALCGIVMLACSWRNFPLGVLLPVVAFWFIFIIGVTPWDSNQPGNIKESAAKVASMGKPVGFLHSEDARITFYLNKPCYVLPDIDSARSWAIKTGGVVITFHYHVLDDSSWECVLNARGFKVYVPRMGNN